MNSSACSLMHGIKSQAHWWTEPYVAEAVCSRDLKAACLLVDGAVCVCVCVCVHTLEYYSVKTENEILSFATKWMDLEGIMLSEIS